MDIYSKQNEKCNEKSLDNNNSDSIDELQKKENFVQNDQHRLNIQEKTKGRIITSTKMDRITQYYKFLNPPLGCTVYGEVIKGIHQQTGKMWAVKRIKKSQTSKEEQEKLMNEVQILQKLDHHNIIKIFDFFQDDKFLYIFEELCDGGDLFEKIRQEGSLSEKKAADIMKQILSAVNYCHQQNIVLRLLFYIIEFRDIKPEKILYQSEKENSLLKFFDFENSTEFHVNQKLNQKIGTPYYIAPEILNKNYDQKCDIWSCGVILYILLYGYPHFDGKSEDKIIEKVKKGTYSFESNGLEDISKEAKDCIKKLLSYDPTKRYSAQQALQDPWIQKFTNIPEVEQQIIKKILINMINFKKLQKIQETCFKDIFNELAIEEEKQELLMVFQQLDTNNDGKLSRQELLMGYQKIMNVDQAVEVVDNILSQINKNNTGMINYTDFLIASIDKQVLLSQQRLQSTFKIFDIDKSGSICLDEFQSIFIGITDEMLKQIIKEVGQNQDGRISLKEFFKIMERIE
ncbi:unnamed protein product [Paramecium pentaurelia]|uniref:Calcium-dependent protein kinase 1 n=1 Tax=Paramecium pentaurelia TaxID=43138 RepID=A0A8S1VM08_9CILI|nr:unnamed protein product [Paramecium pentaurelia]